MKKRKISGILLTLMLLLTLLPSSFMRLEAKESELIINDSETGTGFNKFNFEGSWGTSNGYPDRFHDGDEHWFNFKNHNAVDPLPSYSIKFKGTGIELYGEKQPTLGIYTVYLDGIKIGEIDAYNATRISKIKVYEKTDIDYGEHILKVELSKTKNALSSSTDGEIDYARVLNPGQSEYQNLFNKNDIDNWMKSLTYDGKKLSNETNYANMFATHKINVSKGDVLTWGVFGKDQYVMEVFNNKNEFLRRVLSTESTVIDETSKVIGVAGKEYVEAKASYTISDDAAAYVRILGNISTIEKFMVFKNLAKGLADWPQSYVSFESEKEKTVLYEKSVLFAGDSITNAVKDPEHPYYGWAGRIGTNNDMKWKNAGISSATISTALSTSSPSNRVINQLNQDKLYDYVILHGGMNDSIANTEIGEISDSYKIEDFDTSTFSGAFEELLYTTNKKFPDAIKGYIVNYATPNSTWGGASNNNGAYFRRAKEICEKWGIPYLDLFDGEIEVDGNMLSYSDDILQVNSGVNMYGGLKTEIHIGSKGYDVISPYIEQWMTTLEKTETEYAISTQFSGSNASTNEYVVEASRVLKVETTYGISEIQYWVEADGEIEGEKTKLATNIGDMNTEFKFNFTDNVKSQKLCIEVTDKNGYKKAFKDEISFKVDSKEPRIEISNEKIVIEQGSNLNVDELFVITWGLSGEGNVLYSINDFSSLSVGNYEIECVAKANNGLEVKAKKEITIKSTSVDTMPKDEGIKDIESKGVNTNDITDLYFWLSLWTLSVGLFILMFYCKHLKYEK